MHFASTLAVLPDLIVRQVIRTGQEPHITNASPAFQPWKAARAAAIQALLMLMHFLYEHLFDGNQTATTASAAALNQMLMQVQMLAL